ncbi:phosphorylase b kinase regulatory subunit beta isoform X3 [Hydra vulgaris]|uniref:Phosphorylase b kinase regulatory subunit n=1 Tax=Hydra vulgaris TaxID=6087 RepID=A0ABM4BF52_HYDVU
MQQKARLDYYFSVVQKQILCHQSLTHGLFPLYIQELSVRHDGHVRDNIYCAMAIWSMSLGYRHLDNDGGRTHLLQQSTVKCMRGLLFFFMLQADKVEAFKKEQQPDNALSVKFDIITADVWVDPSYKNLQIDCISLYLLVLTQMIASGLNIIATIDEVHFIQNLVYYVERSYRTADFGIWERGTRYNNGRRELHASSIGMAIAALEAINGFNLYGDKGTLSSVIYVDPDAHYRNKSILHSLLPRESNSKTTDAALLTVVGFPAFSIDDEILKKETKNKIVTRLSGKYGFKRFLRDGYGTVFDKPGQHYEKAELKNFEGIECEWPIFTIFMALEALFTGDRVLAKSYLDKLEPLYIYKTEGKILPKYFYVLKEDIESSSSEKLKEPNLDFDNTYLMGQSLLLIANLLIEELITPTEIDPLQRHLHSSMKYRYGFLSARYSSFKASESDLVLQVCLISQNENLQANLATYGIETQTPKEIEPIVICAPQELVRVYEELGKNQKLNLSGRPVRPLGALGTSKIYRICGKTVVTYPIILDQEGFYMSLDKSLLVDDLKTCLAFIRKCWNLGGRPTVCLYLQDHNFRGHFSSEMVDFMAELKTGNIDGVNIKLGRLQMLVSTGCVEHLDYLTTKHCSKMYFINIITNQDVLNFSGFESECHPALEYNENETDEELKSAKELSTPQLVDLYHSATNMHKRMSLLDIILHREGSTFSLGEFNVQESIEICYIKASKVYNWDVLRHGAALLGKSVASLSPSITSMLVCGKQVCLGAFGCKEHVIMEPLTPSDIKKIFEDECMGLDSREVSLHQEIILHLGAVISTNLELFKGMLKIRVGWIIQAMKICLQSAILRGMQPIEIFSLYPHEIKQLLIAVLSGKGTIRKVDITPRNALERRRLEGALNRLPQGFYSKFWRLLEQCPQGIQLGLCHLQQQPILSVMTKNEIDYKIQVEELLSNSTTPVERQMSVELIMIISTILDRNPELQIQSTIQLMKLMEDAIQLYLNTNGGKSRDDFFSLEPAAQNVDLADSKIKNGSTTYLAHSAISTMLQNSLILSHSTEVCSIM